VRPGESRRGTALAVLIAISFSHLLNDIIQSLLPAIYPVLKSTFALNFGQVGLITFTFQLTASVMQPLVGYYTDQRPSPFSLPVGMGASLVGLVLLSMTSSFPALLLAAGLVGLGSGIFHPEASRVARRASGGRYGFAQSVFQVGGSTGSAVGPLLAASSWCRVGNKACYGFPSPHSRPSWGCFRLAAGTQQLSPIVVGSSAIGPSRRGATILKLSILL
jgi:MFS transporter, FSR family, fosmidomycin resistance protein